jgi:hypothetical protein
MLRNNPEMLASEHQTGSVAMLLEYLDIYFKSFMQTKIGSKAI